MSGAEEGHAEEPVPEEEEEEVQLSLDEYLEKKKSERTGELFKEKEARQIVEDFTNAVQLTKDGKTPDFIEPLYEKVFSKKNSGRKKQLITDLGFQAPPMDRRFRENDSRGGRGGRNESGRNDSDRGGRGARGDFGRGGRNGRGEFGRSDFGRGGRGRGRGRFSAPNVSDLQAFPTLN